MGKSLYYLGIWAAVTVVTFLIGTSPSGTWVPFIIWLPLSAAAYVASLHLHPRRDCWACDGSGKHPGTIFAHGKRACLTCGGSGWRLRWGARMLRINSTSPARWFHGPG